VFNDCPDIEGVAGAVLARALWNQGQVCTASSRILVHKEVKEQFLKAFLRKIDALVPGDPLRPETKFGALVSEQHLSKVVGYVASGESEGAKLRYRSEAAAPFPAGFYFPPMVFDDVSPRHRIAQEEIFGPVLSVIPFSDEREAAAIANSTIYGLSAILWTRDLGRASRMIQGINAGWISVYSTVTPGAGPAGGVVAIGGNKESGMGVEGGIEGLRAFMSSTAAQIFT
jgi:acyl-CoA reductase-like NAD-dependent aldehyde dehydrogenase